MAQRSNEPEYIGAEVDSETKGKFKELAWRRRMSQSELLREQVYDLLEESDLSDDDEAEKVEA